MLDVTSGGFNFTTKQGTVISNTGIISSGVQFDARVAIADMTTNVTPLLSPASGNFSIFGWIFPYNAANSALLIGKQTCYNLQLNTTNPTDKLVFSVNTNVGTKVVTGHAPMIGKWNFFAVWYNSGLNTINMNLNYTGNYSNTIQGGIPSVTNESLTVGSTVVSASNIQNQIDEIGICNKALTQYDINFLYNFGSGRTYNFI